MSPTSPRHGFIKACMVLAWFVAAPGDMARAQDLVLPAGFSRLPLVTKLAFEDGRAEYGIERALDPGGGLPFERTDKLHFGFSEHPYWLKAVLRNDTEGSEVILLFPQPAYDKIDLWLADASGAITQEFHHEYAAPARNLQTTRVPFFRLALPKGHDRTLVLRVENVATMNFALELCTPRAFERSQQDESLWYGLIFGAILILALYNLLLFLSIRDRTYGLYVAYLFLYLAANLLYSALVLPLFFSGDPGSFFRWYQTIFSFLYVATLVSAWLFSRSFLSIKPGRTSRVVAALLASLAVLLLMRWGGIVSVQLFYVVANSFSMLAMLFLVGIGARRLAQGFRPALFYVVAWGFNGVGLILSMLMSFGSIPVNFLSYNSGIIGSLLEAVLLSLALGHRINLYRSEREKAQRSLIAQQEASLQRQTRLATSFARFVPREFLYFLNRESIEDVQLGDQVQKSMTVMFSDIRSFTAMSEKMDLSRNFSFVNRYLGRIGPIIHGNGGFIDKYIGDAIMALFAGDAEPALRCAAAMQAAAEELSIGIGIGIHRGDVVLGTVGTEEHLETTVISEAVNSASRLEGLTKHYGSGIIASEAALGQVRSGEGFDTRFLDIVKVKGSTRPLRIHEVIPRGDAGEKSVHGETKAIFESAGESYRAGRLSEALSAFEEVLAMDPSDGPARVFADRCRHYLEAGLPDGWDGVTVMGEK